MPRTLFVFHPNVNILSLRDNEECRLQRKQRKSQPREKKKEAFTNEEKVVTRVSQSLKKERQSQAKHADEHARREQSSFNPMNSTRTNIRRLRSGSRDPSRRSRDTGDTAGAVRCHETCWGRLGRGGSGFGGRGGRTTKASGSGSRVLCLYGSVEGSSGAGQTEGR